MTCEVAWFRSIRARVPIVTLLNAIALLAPCGVHAQSAMADVSAAPQIWRWSPLRLIGDLGLPAPLLPDLPRLLELPGRRPGAAGMSENPARLNDEIDSAWNQVVFSANSVAGSYRRPLDPASVSSLGISLAGWRRIGARVAAIGRVAVEREALSGGSYSAFTSPYGSSPFVPTDTNRPSLGRTIVTLEGAEGVALGAWRLGIAAGYLGRENSSSQSVAAQIGRASSTGLTLAAARALGSRASVGLYGRRLQNSESVNLIANPQTIRVYRLDGYVSVEPADFSAAFPVFLRRADRAATALGADVDVQALGASWSAHAERQSLEERQMSSLLASNPPTDRWRTSGSAVGGVAQRAVRGLLATLRADWTVQRGDADRAAASPGVFRADASRLEIASELRYASSLSPWSFAAMLSLGRDHQAATDGASRITTDIVALMPGVAGELARRVTDRLTIALAYGRSQFTPNASVPSSANRGKAYTLLIAPAIEVAAAAARADQGGVTARWRTGVGFVSIRAWASRTQPIGHSGASVLLPAGGRSRWGFATSVEPAR